MSGAEESVKVAVRVRPFNKRERQRNAQCIIQMSGQKTTILDPNDPDETKTFTFDHSYWSHDQADELEDGYFKPKPGSPYKGQREVFNDIGVGILRNALQGYNTSLFAYGQTGSGKSWSVVGYGANRGIVPRFCEELFNEINEKKQQRSTTEYEVVFSMLEIYNEKVRDLLNPKAGKSSLKVRQHPKKGFYAEGLLVVPVKGYDDIEMRMEEGTKNRTIAATNMNATSSRAHTIVGVTFLQKMKNAAGKETTKSSIVNLVDLAGSERAESTGATGDRLKEGAAINQSLSSLGNCLMALAERSEGKKVRVPFRDSMLTKLLKNALGGNSKTIMIAALSPADINYEETLSTLRYADRTKQIKTKATINEDPTEKLIRDLQEENEKLKALLASGGKIEKIKPEDDDDDDDNDEDESGMSEEELKARVEEELSARMAENARMMKEMEQKWEEKLAAAESENKEKDEKERQLIANRKSTPHLYNLNPDVMLTGMIVHLLKKGINKIGRNNHDPEPDVPLLGINIRDEHGEICSTDDGKFNLKSYDDAKLLVNGEPVSGVVELHHHDRIMIGSSHLYVYSNPNEASKMKSNGVAIPEVSYEVAQEEIAHYSGINMKKNIDGSESKNMDDILLKEQMADFLPEINEANGMSEELDKKVQFEAIILKYRTRDEIFVKVTQLETGYIWYWKKEKFINRKYVMCEMFEDYENGESWDVPKERDPFIESPETECLIGVSHIYMECLSYMIELKASVPVVDYRGINIGTLNVSVIPCEEDGRAFEDDSMYVETPDELEGKRLDFKIVVKSASGLPKRYTDIYCRYDVFTYENISSAIKSQSVNVAFYHTKQVTIDKASKKILDFLSVKPMVIQIWGKQKPGRTKPVNNAAKLGQTTREIMKLEALRKMQGGKVSKKPMVSVDMGRSIADNLLMRKRMESLQKKLLKIKSLCEDEEKKGNDKVSTSEVLAILGNLPPIKLYRKNSTSSSSSDSSSSDDEKDSEKKRKKKRKKKKSKDKENPNIVHENEKITNDNVKIKSEKNPVEIPRQTSGDKPRQKSGDKPRQKSGEKSRENSRANSRSSPDSSNSSFCVLI